jgi:hypothetical protein
MRASDVTPAGGQRRAFSGIRALKNFYQDGIPARVIGKVDQRAMNECCYVT